MSVRQRLGDGDARRNLALVARHHGAERRPVAEAGVSTAWTFHKTRWPIAKAAE